MSFGKAVLLALVSPSAATAIATTRSRLFSPPRLETLADAQATAVIRIPKFLSTADIDELHQTAADVAANTDNGALDLHRRQGCAENTWFTVFLNHRLKELLPQLHDALFDAARHADGDEWSVLDNRHELAMRCVEYHSVSVGGGIPMDKHHDFGSLLTLDVMLSEPGVDFEGGTFCTLEPDGSMTRHVFEQGDLMVFLSHKYHCVEPVTTGQRRVLVAEIWEGLPRRCVRRCNSPWGACACSFAHADSPPLYLTKAHSKVKPCLKLMTKSDDELRALSQELASDPVANADEWRMVGSHGLWKKRQELDKELSAVRMDGSK